MYFVILQVPYRVLSLDMDLKSLWSRMRFMVEVITVGGGLSDLLGGHWSGSAFSTPVVCVSMSVVLRGVKKVRVNPVFRGNLTAAAEPCLTVLCD
jgi:hypothetical protein